MDRTEILASMGELKLYGMKAAYDEIVATAVKREHEPARIIGDLLSAEISEKQARSIKYQITIAKMPCAKEIEEFTFEGCPSKAPSVRARWRTGRHRSARLCLLLRPRPGR